MLRQCATADGVPRGSCLPEYSSGSSVRHGGITKTGNVLARRVLIEGAWIYRLPARVSRKLHDRNVEISTAIRDIAWKGQIWVCSPYRQLAAAGNPKVVVTIAIAREQLYLGYCSDCAAQIPKPTQSAYSNARRSTTTDP